MVKGTPNHIPMNIICKEQTSHEPLEDSNILILPVVLITPTHIVLMTGPKSGSLYPPSA